jgi:hypothetical protein
MSRLPLWAARFLSYWEPLGRRVYNPLRRAHKAAPLCGQLQGNSGGTLVTCVPVMFQRTEKPPGVSLSLGNPPSPPPAGRLRHLQLESLLLSGMPTASSFAIS